MVKRQRGSAVYPQFKGIGAFPNKRFATQNKQMYIRLHCLLVQCHR